MAITRRRGRVFANIIIPKSPTSCSGEDDYFPDSNGSWDESPLEPSHPLSSLPDDYPADLRNHIILTYLQRAPMSTVLQFRCVSAALRDLIDGSFQSRHMCRDDVWLVSPLCEMDQRHQVVMKAIDMVKGKTRQIPLPADLQSCAFANFQYGQQTLRLRSVSGDFGSGLVILEVLGSPALSDPRDRFVFNPITKKYVRLCSGEGGQRFRLSQQIGRFRAKSEYLSWAGMHPQLIDPRDDNRRRIPSGFEFRPTGSVQMHAACAGNFSYIRYEAKILQDRLIEYDVLNDVLRERTTRGLPESLNSKYDYLFENQGQIYLGAVLSSREREIDEVAIYELNGTAATESDPEWTEATKMPYEMLEVVYGSFHRRIMRGLRFVIVNNVLLVIGGRPRNSRMPLDVQTHVFAYDFVRLSWDRDEKTARSLKDFDLHSFVFRPRLDIDP